VNDYIEQLIMMNDENGAVGASDTGPSAGYTFVFLFLFTDFLVWLADNKMEYIYTHTLPRNHHPSAFQKKKSVLRQILFFTCEEWLCAAAKNLLMCRLLNVANH
jgi:hypothetical protein